ncbi:metalloendopeptidase-like membrane protein [Rivularia sp. PCC 7116]|uniref:M23 family metallopeptidase n=1 Tax=Rivularia sp. PCC 7116 TaxID=373994 RepID=UPI00029F4DE6|nr:M23 family metallopeptidase [Rivularia sp. PCC 7116]AFY53725.1 metalloendopeptidase-like membrane protein [Rivularia sp. PCC 7116]
MTQRKNSAHNNSQSAWQRSLPAQSLCWLGSFSLLSSGFVVAQTTSGIDNIVPVKSSQASSIQKAAQGKAVIISGAPTPEPARPKVEFSKRRTRLKQRLSGKKSTASPAAKKPAPRVKVTTNNKKKSTLRTRLKRSRTNSVVVKLKKKAPTTRQRVVIKKNSTRLKPSAPKTRIASPQKPRTILPRTTTVRKPKKDYNNALIDPTNYGKKYQAPNSVVITGRNNGCSSVASGQGISGNCGASRSRTRVSSKKTNPAKKTTPSWLKASQNASIASVTSPRSVTAKTKTATQSPKTVSSAKVKKTVLPAKSAANTYRPTNTIKRVASVTPNVVKKAVKSATPSIRTNTARVASRRTPKQAYSSNRFIPQPSSFTPQTTVSKEAIAPSGGMLPAPIMANNTAPRPSAVNYDIPLASALPKVTYQRAAYNPNGLVFPLSVPSAISSVFGWRQHPITGDRRFHSGIDIAAASGTPVLAAYSGQVEISDWVSGYGLTVILNHNSAQQTLYGHMSELFVRPGQWVERGSIIGRVGNTGNSTGPHLHFETRQLTPNGWVATNPGAQLQYALNQFLQSLQTAQVTEDSGS